MSLSAVVITKNEERNISDCLKSIQFADEIILVDSGSQDQTLTLAKQYTDSIFERPLDNFSNQKNFAISKVTQDWILLIDADERVTDQLKVEILETISKDQNLCFRIRRKTNYLGQWMSFTGLQFDKPIRLFKKNSGKFIQPIHEYFETSLPVKELKNTLLHFTIPTLAEEKRKGELYSDFEAQFMKEKGKSYSWFYVYLKIAATFMRKYFLEFGFLDGRGGFIFSYYSAQQVWLKYKKLENIIQKSNLEQEIEKLFSIKTERLPNVVDSNDFRLRELRPRINSFNQGLFLDVGCGKGRFVEVFAREDKQIIGVELSKELLKFAQEKKVATLQASATLLPFESNSFDLVYAIEVIEHIPDVEKAIKEMSRVLKPNGKLILIDRNKYSMSFRRFMVPNALIKRWHELRGEWFYPTQFPFREQWFSKNQILKTMDDSLVDCTAKYIESDSEKKCSYRLFFDRIPILRHFIFWEGTKKS